MRYYEVYIPGRTRTEKSQVRQDDGSWRLEEREVEEPLICSNVRSLRNLPEGTRVYRTITERDGTLVESVPIPVEGGRVKIAGRGKRRPRIHYG